MAFAIEYGEWLYQWRFALRITQRELASMLGISQNLVSRWERGLQLPNLFQGQVIRTMFKQRKAAV